MKFLPYISGLIAIIIIFQLVSGQQLSPTWFLIGPFVCTLLNSIYLIIKK